METIYKATDSLNPKSSNCMGRRSKIVVLISLMTSFICFVEISDDGKGFEVEEVLQNEKLNHHFGLMILEERVNILHGTIDFILISSNKTSGSFFSNNCKHSSPSPVSKKTFISPSNSI